MKIGKKDLLLVIDMQNVYLPEEDWACPRITTCIPYIQSLLSVFPQEQVIFTRFLAPKEPIGIWKKYNELNKELIAQTPLKQRDSSRLLVLDKTRISYGKDGKYYGK